ncbi:MAG: YHS domain-containing (seleno)protein [Pseudomonadota bacterium]
MLRLSAALFAILLAAVALPAAAEVKKPEIYTDFLGKALKGYDAVAYHLERRPVKGSENYAYEWNDATWWFSSAANRDRFIADPERWAPQYGGYCAWAIAKDMVRPINPTIFRIFDDKLYLNLNMKVHKEWLDRRHGFIATANEKWPDVLVLD